MATKISYCRYDNEKREVFSNYDFANDFINHIPAVIEDVANAKLYTIYYCPKCLGWHIMLDVPDETGKRTYKYPDYKDVYDRVVNDYKKRVKRVTEENDVIVSSTVDKTETASSLHNINVNDDMYLYCEEMMSKLLSFIDESFNTDITEKTPKWIQEVCNYVYKYTNHAIELNDIEHLSYIDNKRIEIYDKFIDVIYLIFSKIDECCESDTQFSYELYRDLLDAFDKIVTRLYPLSNIYEVFSDFIDTNKGRFTEYSVYGDCLIKENNWYNKSLMYTVKAEESVNIKNWSDAYDYCLTARKYIEKLSQISSIHNEDAIQLIDRLIDVHKLIENVYSK